MTRTREHQTIRERLANIEKKIDGLRVHALELDTLLKHQAVHPQRELHVPKALASLPEHLRRTASTIATMGQSTAEQVAARTGRTRAAESDYLNQLANQGFLRRERRGREIYFLVFSLHTFCIRCGARVPMTLSTCPTCGMSFEIGQR